MNIFATCADPKHSAQVLPDKHVVKMPLECCQMLAIIYSKWYLDWGEIHKKDGTPYKTKKGAFRNHPCTVWASKNEYNLAWLIQHGCSLSTEYRYRYGKEHSCEKTLFEAKEFSIRRLIKRLCVMVWQTILPVPCLMSSSMMIALILSPHTRCMFRLSLG